MKADVDAYVFDLYGTLVDYGALGARYGGGSNGDAFVAAWRQKQLQYTFAATLMDRYVDFDTLTGLAYDYVAAVHGRPLGVEARLEAVRAWTTLPAFPEAATALRELRGRGYKLAVLSNGTPGGIAASLASSGLAAAIDVALSVDAARAFKPLPSVYRLAVSHFNARPERLAFVSSNGWDATGATEFGLSVTWCNRAGLPAETFGSAPSRTIASLAELVG